MASYTYPSLPSRFYVGDTITFNYTGNYVSWNPRQNGVNIIKIECIGAIPPDYNNGDLATIITVYGSKNCSDRQYVYVYVGGAEGWNGGGSYSSATYTGGPGAGGTDVRYNSTSLSNRLIVAGGCGGGEGYPYGRDVGGPSGYPNGGKGRQGYPDDGDGGGGTQNSGGDSYYSYGGNYGNSGGWGYGGNGYSSYGAGGNGGGGGGYYGGGGGAVSGSSHGGCGGGGSSYMGGVYSSNYNISSLQHISSSGQHGKVVITVMELGYDYAGSISGSTSHTDAPTGSTIQRRLTSGAEGVYKVEVYIDSTFIETSYSYSNNSWYNINIPEQTFYNLSYGSHTLYVRYLNSSNTKVYENTHSFYKNSINWYITPTLNSTGYVAAENIPFTMSGAKASRIDVRLGSYNVGSFYNVTSGARNTISISSSVFNGLSVGNHNLEFKIYRGSTLERTITHTYKKINFNGAINGIISGGYTETIPENTIQRRLTAGTGVNRVEVYIGSTRIETSTSFALNTWYNINIPESTFYTLPYGNNTLAVKYLNSSGSLLYQNTATIKKNTINWAINITLDPEGYSTATELDFYMTGAKATKIEAYLGDTLVDTFLDVTPSTQLTIDGITTEIFKALANGDNTLSFKIYRGTQLEKTLNFTYLKVPYRGSITGIVSEGYKDTPTGIKRILTVGEDVVSAKNYINDTLLSTSNSCSLNTPYNFDIPNDVFYHLPDGDHTIKVKYFDNTDTEVFETTATIKKNPVDFNISTTLKPEGYYTPETFNITLTGTRVDKIEVNLLERTLDTSTDENPEFIIIKHLIGALNNVNPNVPVEVNLITQEIFRLMPKGENMLSFDIYRGTKLEKTIDDKIYVKNKPIFDIDGTVTQESFEVSPLIEYSSSCDVEGILPDKIYIYLEEELIKTTTQPLGMLTLNEDLFIGLDNGTYSIRVSLEKDLEIVKTKIIGEFQKNFTSMTIVSHPIPIPSHVVTLSLDVDIKEMPEDIEIHACNNAYDDVPVWEDIKDYVLSESNFILTNSNKTEENGWGFAIKIFVPSLPFRMSETIIGGYQVPLTSDQPQTATFMKHRLVMIDEKTNRKLNMKIAILENQFLLGVDIDIEEKTKYFKEYYNSQLLTENMIERLNGIGIDVTK